jgi:hypothetical protein
MRPFIELVDQDWGEVLHTRAHSLSAVWRGRCGYSDSDYYPVSIEYFGERSSLEITTILWAYSCFGARRIRLYLGQKEPGDAILRMSVNPFDNPDWWAGKPGHPMVCHQINVWFPVEIQPGEKGPRDRPGQHDDTSAIEEARSDDAPEGGMDQNESDGDSSHSKRSAKSDRKTKKGLVRLGAVLERRTTADIAEDDELWDNWRRLSGPGDFIMEGDQQVAIHDGCELGAAGWRWFIREFVQIGVVSQAVMFFLMNMTANNGGLEDRHPVSTVPLSTLRLGSATRVEVGNIDPMVEWYIHRHGVRLDEARGTCWDMIGDNSYLSTGGDILNKAVVGWICFSSVVDQFLAVDSVEPIEYTRAWAGVPCGDIDRADLNFTDQEGWREFIEAAVGDVIPGKYMFEVDDIKGEGEHWWDWVVPATPERVEPCLYSLIHWGAKYAPGDELAPLELEHKSINNYYVPSSDGEWVGEVVPKVKMMNEVDVKTPTFLTVPGTKSGFTEPCELEMRFGLVNYSITSKCSPAMVGPLAVDCIRWRTIGTIPMVLRYERSPSLWYEFEDGDDNRTRVPVKTVQSCGSFRSPKVAISARLGGNKRFQTRSGAGGNTSVPGQ